MKERPILFNAEMVKAILDGRKTQTRRVIKGVDGTNWLKGASCHVFDALHKCPFGQVGDEIWVRETWAETTNIDQLESWPYRPYTNDEWGEDENFIDSCVIYRADGQWEWCDGDGYLTEKSCWKPSIHMPRSASRLQLKITNVRVERLNDISEEDSKAEGVFIDIKNAFSVRHPHYKAEFKTLWNSIYGTWADDPWVWVVDFEVLKK